jgi:site-specific DNA recombinase
MSKTNSTDQAATYFRMSKDEQEHSVERQRGQVLPYAAAHGYTITGEYVDEGIPGWKGEEDRDEFARLLRDAARGLFGVILCDDVDRFGRLDLHEYGEAVQKCRRAGVRLETVAQGPIDWDDPMLQVSDAIRMVFKRQQSSDTARRILTRFILMAREGKWVNGRPPYGYLKDPATGKLVPDPKTVHVVEWLFRNYAERVVSLRWLAEELNARAVASPSGGKWTGQGVHKLLKNRNYLGDLHWNAVSKGRFQETDGAGVVRRKAKGERRRSRAEMIIVPGSHPALVDRDVFEKVAAKLHGNRERTTPLPGGGDYVLNGLMVCGHCGSRMLGRRGFNRNPSNRRPVYICNGYQRWGKAHCGCHWVEESEVLDAVIAALLNDYLDPANLATLEAEMERQAKAETDPANEKRLRREMAELDKNIAKGNRNLTLADPDMIAGIAQTVRELRQQRERLAAALATPPAASGLADLERAKAELWRLREGLESDDPALVRAVLRETVEKVELWWDHRPKGGMTKAVFSRGLVHLNMDDARSHSCLFYPGGGTGSAATTRARPSPAPSPRGWASPAGRAGCGASGTRPTRRSSPRPPAPPTSATPSAPAAAPA